MKIVLALAFFLCCAFGQETETAVETDAEDIFEEGIPLVNSTRGGKVMRTESAICTNPDFVGKSFCRMDDQVKDDICNSRSFINCYGTGGSGYEIPCPPSSPYCTETSSVGFFGQTPNGDARCTSTLPASCPQPFDCTGAGYYPDPLNCRKFYGCVKNAYGGFNPTAYACRDGYVFDPAATGTAYCRYNNNDYCSQVSCNGDAHNVLMSYKTYPWSAGFYIAMCRRDGKSPLVFKCPAGFKADTHAYPPTCIFFCSGGPKTAPIEGDSKRYHECVIDGFGEWVPVVSYCPTGYYYASLGRCY